MLQRLGELPCAVFGGLLLLLFGVHLLLALSASALFAVGLHRLRGWLFGRQCGCGLCCCGCCLLCLLCLLSYSPLPLASLWLRRRRLLLLLLLLLALA